MVRVVNLILKSIIQLLRWILLGIRFVTPWAIRSVWFTMTLMSVAVVSIWVGVPTAIRRIANQWVDRAVAAGFPTAYDYILYYFVEVFAFFTIVAGWIVTAFVTVILVRMIFWFTYVKLEIYLVSP